MDNEELLQALRTALDAADPPPAAIVDDALRAHQWDASPENQAEMRPTPELADAGMRGPNDGPRDLSFVGGRYEIELTVETTATADVTVIVVITPAVATATLISPYGAPTTAECDSTGRTSFSTNNRLIAVEFEGSPGVLLRTPLVDLQGDEASP